MQQRGIETVGFRPAMLARDGDAVRMDHIGFDAVRPQPTSQPESVAAGFVGDRDARNRPSGRRRFITPALQQTQQRLDIGCQLLQRVTFDPRDDAGDQPTRLAHLNHRDQRAILVKSGERSAQVIRLWHGAPRRFRCSDDDAVSLAARPIASESFRDLPLDSSRERVRAGGTRPSTEHLQRLAEKRSGGRAKSERSGV